MTIITKNDRYNCLRAEQHVDGLHLFDESGSLIVILATPGAVQGVEGGEITVIEQPEDENADDDVWAEMAAALREGVNTV